MGEEGSSTRAPQGTPEVRAVDDMPADTADRELVDKPAAPIQEPIPVKEPVAEGSSEPGPGKLGE